MNRLLILALLTAATPAFAQHPTWSFDITTGAIGYTGDLSQRSVNFRTLRPSVGLTASYHLTSTFAIRGGLMLGKTAAYDSYNTDSLLRLRNLSFESPIAEASLTAELNLLPPELFEGYPYIFAGVGLFHFEPSGIDKDGNKVALRPLTTEGQGLPEYPDRKPYDLTQFCIPFGAGFKLRVHPNWDLGAELGFRKIFTDYLDDVSTTYIDPNVLINRSGIQAVQMAYRGNEVGSNLYDPYPPDNTVRGNPDKNDWYYFFGIKFIWYPGMGRDPVEKYY